MNTSNNAGERVCTALQWDPADTSCQIEPLVTLPHSFVARVQRASDQPMIFKQAGDPGFAAGMRKELTINRDVLSQFSDPVGPAFIAGDESTELPWILFEDIAVNHQPATTQPPLRRQIELFVDSLARTHAQARNLPLADLFQNVDGDRRVSDGAEHVPAVLDEFLHRMDHNRFPARNFELVRSLRDNIPKLAELLDGDETLMHGDAHFANALYSDSEALLIDWALAVIGPGEVDLAHALAMNLPRLFSVEYEPDLLERYAATCCEYGSEVSTAEVRERYRSSLLLTVIVAVGMNTVPGMSDLVWSFMFTNAVHTALDHEAQALLG